MRTVFAVVISTFLIACAGQSPAQDSHPIMRPDRATKQKWIEGYRAAPRTAPDRLMRKNRSGSVDLLGYLTYSPTDRDQGNCGNCWVWAGTGCMEIALNMQESIKDRLSVQYVSSCAASLIDKTCCDGGWLADIASFYSITRKAVPWSNTGAYWQDGDASCDIACGSVSGTPNYPIASISAETIETQGVGQATAINNIKAVLDQGRPVWFGFFMCNNADWSTFFNFWDNSNESALFNFNYSCGKPWNSQQGGGHAVLCVGYNDVDPLDRYWIILNSWGTTSGRPNGLFRVSMDINYDCADTSPDYNLYWQALDISFSTTPTPTATSSSVPTSTPTLAPPPPPATFTPTVPAPATTTPTSTVSNPPTTTPTSTVPNPPTITPTPTIPYVPPAPATATPSVPPVAPTLTPVPPAGLETNSTALNPGEHLAVTFGLNESIEKKFTVFAVVILPDGSMLNVATLDAPPRPLVSNYPGLQAPFTYPLISLNVPPGAPPGRYQFVMAFFDAAAPVIRRSDAFLEVSSWVTVK